jgi:signal transduction histidine kinase
LRNRIFWTIFGVLFVTTVAVSLVHLRFFADERHRLIDQQVEVVASSLLAQGLREGDIDDYGDIVADALGSDHPTSLVVLRDTEGRVLYQNENAATYFENSPAPLFPQWSTIERGRHVIRLLNLRIAPDDNILQVGLLLDGSQVRWRTLSRSVFVYLGVVMIVMVGASVLLQRAILKPLRELAVYLRHLADSIGTGGVGPEPQKPIALERAFARASWDQDEFLGLIAAVREMSEKLDARFRVSRASATQMAHELKTPMTIIRNCLESALPHRGRVEAAAPLLHEAIAEIDHLNRVVTSFLEWARAEDPALTRGDIEAVRVTPLLEDTVAKLNRIFAQRARIVASDAGLVVFARRDFVYQLFRNLIENALKYSPATEPVEIHVREGRILSIQDHGPGIPDKVRDQLGAPFNVGTEGRGTGLGLAWVCTVCRVYGWTFSLRNEEGGCHAEIDFGQPDEA